MRFSLPVCLALLVTGLAACSDASSAGGSATKPGYVLAVSWQPAFCETAPRKRECRTQTPDRIDARQFSLHGLWPQPGTNVYCGVPQSEIDRDKSGRWRDLDTPRIAEPVWRELQRVMPGTMSGLHEHEWIKHGTCHGGDIDRYYADSLRLMAAINGSPVRELFAGSIGRELDGARIRAAFDEAFGAGAGSRVRISCERDRDSGRQLVVELLIGLSGDTGADSFATLVGAAPPTDPGCPGGIIDRAGDD